VLREDFSGTGALARAWVSANSATSKEAKTMTLRKAIAVDHDASVTARIAPHERLVVRTGDVRRVKDTCDVLCATNFAVGYFHTRPHLLAYLRHARACLSRGGIVFCDMYTGSSAFVPCEQSVKIKASEIAGAFTYTWRQVSCDITTGLVRNAIDFSVVRGKRTMRMIDAFTYHWRLWSPAELREAMLEAGFSRVEMYDRMGDAIDHEGNIYTRALQEGDCIDDPSVLYFAARK
jgi:hypothetical protein